MRTYIMTTERTLREQIGEIREDEVRLVFPEGLYFAGGDETECLRIKKERLIMEGQGDAAIYDNRGHMINAHPKPMEPSSLAHTVLIETREAEIRGLTFVNGCNIDFEYRGKLLPKVSDVVTQAYAFGAWDTERICIEKCGFYSILDTFGFKNVSDVTVTGSYIQGNNDFLPIGDSTYLKNCRVRHMGPYPMWSAGAKRCVFDGCEFRIDPEVEDFAFTKRGGNLAFLNCRIFGGLPELRMEIEPRRESRYYLFNTTYNGQKARFRGWEESFIDLSESEADELRRVRPDTLTIGVEGSRKLERAGKLLLGRTPDAVSASDNVDFRLDGREILLTSDAVGRDREGWLELRLGPLRQRAYLEVIGEKIKEPEIARALTYTVENGRLRVDFEVLGDDENLSFVQVGELCRLRAGEAMDLTTSDVGKKIPLTLHAMTAETRETVCEPVLTREIAAGDVGSGLEISDFRGYFLTDPEHLHMGKSDFAYLGEEVPNVVRFVHAGEAPFTYAYGADGAAGVRGLLYTGRGGCIVNPTAEPVKTLSLEIDLAVEKSTGEGFGSANGQYLELIMGNLERGIALRLEREASSDRGVFMSARRYLGGVNELIGEKIFTENYKTYCTLSADFDGKSLAFCIEHDGDVDTVTVPCESLTTEFMLRSSGTVGVGNRFLLMGLRLVTSKAL